MSNDHHLIEQYLSDKLSAEEQLLFNQRLDDAGFRKTLMATGVSLDILKDQADKNFLQALKQSSSTELSPSKEKDLQPSIESTGKQKSMWPRLLKIAAIGAIVFCASLPFILPGDEKPNDLERHFVPYPPVDFARGSNIESQENLKLALKHYVNEDYQEALKLFQDIEPTNDTLQLYAANCQMKLKDYKPAEKTLFNLTESMALNIRNNAEWYLFYTFLSQGKMENAKIYFDAITKNPKQPFRNRALMLKEYIK